MKASDLFLRCLEEQGVEVMFGVPGEENADLMISLLDSPIKFIICRHEQGAAFMADLYGRLTGKPGVCMSTLGPGATNLTTGVANANMDNSPLVAIVGQASVRRLHKESHQNMDTVSMFAPITKWAASIHDETNIPEVINKAFKLARTEKAGATLIELPENIAKRQTDVLPFRPSRVRRPGADDKAVDIGLELIANAKTPLILAGNGCIRTRPAKQLKRFVEKTNIFLVTTFMGKGSLSALHDKCLFTAGLAANDHATTAFKVADLVICIGYDMVEWHPEIWNVGNEKQIIHIDFEPAEVDEHYRADVEIVGDLAGILWAINEKIGPEHLKDGDCFKELRLEVLEELKRYDRDDGFPMKPQRVVSELRSVMRPEDILISDVGAHKMWVARHYLTYEPNTCIISNGFCSMGIALPGAISAKMIYPDKNVVGLCGDGGFLMNVQELATAVQYKIPVIFLVWVDGGYGLIKWKQDRQFGKSSHTQFKNPDLAALAESFGCKGINVRAASEFVPAMIEAFANTKSPTVVVLPVDYDENIKLTQKLGDLTCFL